MQEDEAGKTASIKQINSDGRGTQQNAKMGTMKIDALLIQNISKVGTINLNSVEISVI